MKLKIETTTPPGVFPFKALIAALKDPTTAELIGCYPPGEDFCMDNDQTGVSIRFTVLSSEEVMTDEQAKEKVRQTLLGLHHGITYFNSREEWAVTKALIELYKQPEIEEKEAGQ